MKLEMHGTHQGGYTSGARKLYHRQHSSARFRIAILLLVAAMMLLPSRYALARLTEGRQPTTKVQANQPPHKRTAARKAHAPQAEGVTLTTKRATLKPGYKFVRKSNNTIIVAKKRKGTGGTFPTTTVTCLCNNGSGNGSCRLEVVDTIATCTNGTCDTCIFQVEVNAPPTHHRR
jgi:hypothetical protein